MVQQFSNAYTDAEMEAVDNSYDGMYNLLNNRLFIDSQLAYSITDSIISIEPTLKKKKVYGLGTFLEFEYSIPNFISFGSSLEFYDKDILTLNLLSNFAK